MEKKFNVGDIVRISKDGKATKGTGIFPPEKEALLGKITIFNSRYQDNRVWCDEIGTPYSWEWHPDDLTPLDPPSTDLLQAGDVVRLRDWGIVQIYHSSSNRVEYIYALTKGCLAGCLSSFSNFYKDDLKSRDDKPERDIVAIYSGGNLDNIINQSTEGLTLIWERAEEALEWTDKDAEALKEWSSLIEYWFSSERFAVMIEKLCRLAGIETPNKEE